MDLTNPQVTLRQARIEELEAELAKEREKVKELERRNVGFSGLIGLMQTSLEGDTARIGELLDELAAAQATIAEMREALHYTLQAWDYDGVSDEHGSIRMEAGERCDSPTNLDALHEALARECERLAKKRRSLGDSSTALLLDIEAAAHRARKEEK